MTDNIYEPKGPALEYCRLAMNHYKSCPHGCVYCYAPPCLHKKRESFHGYLDMAKDWLERTRKSAAKMQKNGDPGPVHLCFASDPYQPAEKNLLATRQVLEIFKDHGIWAQILTKASSWGLERDMDLLKATRARWGATLTTDDPEESRQWEPGASLPDERIKGLKLAKDAGLTTWVSLEPVISPDAVYRLIAQTHTFVDEYKVGKLNRHKHAKTIDWPLFRARVVQVLEYFGAKFFIKKDLMEAK